MKKNEAILRKRFYTISIVLLLIMIIIGFFSYELEALIKNFPSLTVSLFAFAIFLAIVTYYGLLKRVTFPKEIIFFAPLMFMAFLSEEFAVIVTVILLGVIYLLFKKYLSEQKFSLIIGAISLILFLVLTLFIIVGTFSNLQETGVSCTRIVPDRISNITASCITDDLKDTKCASPRDFPQCYAAGSGEPKWTDGTAMSRGLYLRKGCYNGENPDYLYGSALYLKWTNGTNKEVQYTIDLVLDSKDKTELGYKVVGSHCRETSYWLDGP